MCNTPRVLDLDDAESSRGQSRIADHPPAVDPRDLGGGAILRANLQVDAQHIERDRAHIGAWDARLGEAAIVPAAVAVPTLLLDNIARSGVVDADAKAATAVAPRCDAQRRPSDRVRETQPARVPVAVPGLLEDFEIRVLSVHPGKGTIAVSRVCGLSF